MVTVDGARAERHDGDMDPKPARRRPGPPPDEAIRRRILDTAAKHPDWSHRRLARELRCGRHTVADVLEPAVRIPGVRMRVRADLVAKAEQCGKDVNDVLAGALAHITLPAGWTPDQILDRD